MKPLKAYFFTLQMVDTIRDIGVTITFHQSNLANDDKTIEKYSGVERVPPQLWQTVTFHTEDKSQQKVIREAQSFLGRIGIGFDSGGCYGQRDWELDWSFKYIEGSDQGDAEADEAIEGILRFIENEAVTPNDTLPTGGAAGFPPRGHGMMPPPPNLSDPPTGYGPMYPEQGINTTTDTPLDVDEEC